MNNRRFTRVNYTVEAVIEHEGSFIAGTVANISLHGAFIRTERSLPAGAEVVITFNLNALEAELGVRVQAKSAAAAAEGIGFEFTAMDSDTFTCLYGIVSSVSGAGDALLEEMASFAHRKRKEPRSIR